MTESWGQMDFSLWSDFGVNHWFGALEVRLSVSAKRG